MRKVTIMDIAQKAGVSKATVSMVLNNRCNGISENTRNSILAIAKELNYIPNSVARSLSTKKSNTIGIVLPDITNPFFSQMARAIEDGASSLGYNVILCNTDRIKDKEIRYTELLISKLVDGVIFIIGSNSTSSIKMLNKNNIPLVVVDRYLKDFKEMFGVYFKNKQGIKLGVDYLYSKGKRNIVFVAGPETLEVCNQRLEGYKETMTEYNIYNEDLIFKSDFTISGGTEITKEIIKKGVKADAIFYSNDLMAYGGIKVLLKSGYNIPKDISVIGFDDIYISAFYEPELTTIAQPIYDMGIAACNMLVSVINGEEVKEKQLYFDPMLMERETVK